MAPVIYLILQILLRFRIVSMTELKIALTAPINPVEAGNMLSIHCQVWGLSINSHAIAMARNVTGKNTRISLDNTMMEDADERFFLASRRLQDSTMVYFLSIIDITREDEGVYHCVIRDKESLTELQRRSVTVLFKYFPADIYPICSPSDGSGSLTANAGRKMTLNCTSELGNPYISIEWMKNDMILGNVEKREENGFAILQLSLTTTMDDDGAIYVCHVKSVAFPETQSTCHVGPFKITQDPSATQKSLPDDNVPQNRVLHESDRTVTTTLPDNRKNKGPTYVTTECSEVCDENILYWIIATIIAGTLAVVFCIVGIIIFVRYRRRRKEENEKKESRNSHYQNREAIYAEVETRADDNKLYMALDKSSYISTIDTSRAMPESEPLYSQNTPAVEDPYSTRNVTHTTFGL